MIFKRRNSKIEEIEELKQLLSCDLTEKQRFSVERELNAINKGASGEDDSAYYLNFYYGKSKNWAIIHDLRIEHEGIVAQIDHILINRIFDFYILESKSYKNGIKITENGEFEAYYGNKYFGIPSPLEQNERHIFVLNKFMHKNNILPKRMGVTIRPTYLNYVLISPGSVIKRPNSKKFNSENVIKADTLKTVIDKNADKAPRSVSDIMAVIKISTFSTIETIAQKLASVHTPKKMNWKEKFRVKKTVQHQEKLSFSTNTQENNSKFYCAKCKKGISAKVAKFCWNNKVKFKGRAYCYNCQKLQ